MLGVLQTDSPPAMDGGSSASAHPTPGGESGEEAIRADIAVRDAGVRVQGRDGEESNAD